MRKLLAVALLATLAPLGIAQAATPKPTTAVAAKPKAMAGKMAGHKMPAKKSTAKKMTKTSTTTKKMPARDPKTGRFIKSSSTPKAAAPKTTKK